MDLFQLNCPITIIENTIIFRYYIQNYGFHPFLNQIFANTHASSNDNLRPSVFKLLNISSPN